MSLAEQQAMDALYAIDNVLTIKITMPQAEWDALRIERPNGGRCNFDFTGRRYTWRKSTSVEISGTKFPARPVKFADVGVKKKSFCGSFNNEKPCLHIDFGRFTDSDEIKELIGTRYITLNNSIQDLSYIRQTLGYRMLGAAGLPHSRSNYARVFVNGVPIGQGLAGVNSPGLFVSVEPIMKRYIERNFDDNMDGNLYEIEHHDDFTPERLSHIGVESLSEFEDRADLKFAINHIAANGIAGVHQLFDVEQFIKFYAMEFYLKHWDGYADNTNNTYVYNDVSAVENPGLGNIKFKMIPWGIDQTWQPHRPFRLGRDGIVAKMMREDPASRAKVFDQIRAYRETVFAREIQQTRWTPLIDTMQTLLAGFGVPDLAAKVEEVRHQVRLAESAGYLAAGLPADNTVYLLNETSQALHASNTESVPAGATPPVNFEVYHWPLRDDNDKADLWHIQNLGSGKSVTNVAFDRNLHASNALVSGQGNKLLYTCPALNNENAEEFSLEEVDSPGRNTFSGYCRLVSKRTDLGATFGLDLTPGGRARVHQEGPGSRVYLY